MNPRMRAVGWICVAGLVLMVVLCIGEIFHALHQHRDGLAAMFVALGFVNGYLAESILRDLFAKDEDTAKPAAKTTQAKP